MPVYTTAVTVPADTPETSPVTYKFGVEEDYVRGVVAFSYASLH